LENDRLIHNLLLYIVNNEVACDAHNIIISEEQMVVASHFIFRVKRMLIALSSMIDALMYACLSANKASAFCSSLKQEHDG
jgi:hypothetical protein